MAATIVTDTGGICCVVITPKISVKLKMAKRTKILCNQLHKQIHNEFRRTIIWAARGPQKRA